MGTLSSFQRAFFLRGTCGALAALLLAWPALAAPRGDVRVSARLRAGVLRLGDTGVVNLVVENAEEARIGALPAVEGLRFGRPEGPNYNRSSGFVNGRLYSQVTLSWQIPFRPEAEGDYEIPAFAVEVAGQRLETRPLRVTVVVDITGEDFGYMEVTPSAPRVVEGQPFTVELVFGWDSSTEVNFAELNLPWWEALPGALEVEGLPIPQERRVEGIVVNGRIQVPAEQLEPRERAGRRFLALRISRSYLPTRSGTLEFPTSFFEFGSRARGFGFFDRPRRESHFVQAAPFPVEVVALPSEGQPLDFSGAVGTIAARASADARDVRVGDSIKLTVEWTGQGNLEFFRAPDPAALGAFRGFRVYGSTEEKSFERRSVVYDLAPLSTEVREIPALPLSLFDPAAGRYGTVATAPIPIRVRALEKSAGLADDQQRFERDIADIDARPPAYGAGPEGGALADRFLLGVLVGVPLLGWLARARVRARSGDPAAPLERRRRRALKQLARDLEPAAAEAELSAFAAFLAARTRERAEAWQGRDLARWAAAHAPALSPELRERAAYTLGRLEAAVYGGGAAVEKRELLALARELAEGGL